MARSGLSRGTRSARTENFCPKTVPGGLIYQTFLMFPRHALPFAAALALSVRGFADPGIEFFEKNVRPILTERCLECHSAAKKVKGGLHLDSREGWVKGGDTGPALVPGQP